METRAYSYVDQFIHRLYLGNHFVAKTSFDIEQAIYKKEITQFQLKGIVFVTGLARAGTTALFNAVYGTGSFASLTYAHMPFLLMPNLWQKMAKKKTATEYVERAHQDGLKINSESPEEFDEYFWKTILNNQYIHKDHLSIHQPDQIQLTDFEKYMKAVCISANKNNYLSKNNNNVLRLPALIEKFPTSKTLVVYRNPLDHARSLLKQHQQFCSLQQKDPFALEYFNYLGHHEFGLNHKPFQFPNQTVDNKDLNNLNYWLQIWYQYYAYIITIASPQIHFIAFEDYCNTPANVSDYLNQVIQTQKPIQLTERFTPKPHQYLDYDSILKLKCDSIYQELNQLKKYATD